MPDDNSPSVSFEEGLPRWPLSWTPPKELRLAGYSYAGAEDATCSVEQRLAVARSGTPTLSSTSSQVERERERQDVDGASEGPQASPGLPRFSRSRRAPGLLLPLCSTPRGALAGLVRNGC